MKQTLLVVGDAQAEALALVLRGHDAVSSRYTVDYADVRAKSTNEQFRGTTRFDVIVEQRSEHLPSVLPNGLGRRRVTFSALRFDLLWPLLRPNEHAHRSNAGHTFPWKNVFFESCKEQSIRRDDVLRLFESGSWSPSWPNLDVAFKSETEKLLGADAACDVKIGSYILKHFRRKRLFLAPNVPANALIAELAFRVLHACFGRDDLPDRESIQDVLSAAGASDLMARAAVPIHPAVAHHFSLEWYDPKSEIDASFAAYHRDLLDYTFARVD